MGPDGDAKAGARADQKIRFWEDLLIWRFGDWALMSMTRPASPPNHQINTSPNR
jgi:hypothetical protein